MFRIIIGFFFGFGLYLIMLDIFQIPFYKTSRAALNLSKAQKGRISVFESGLESIAIWLSKRLRLNPFKRAKIDSDLKTANSELTPELHKANSIIKGVVIGFLAIPVYPISPLLSLFIIIFAYYRYRKAMSLDGKIKEKRRQIEYELPRLVSTIEKTLKHNRDVLYMLEAYSENAGAAMKHELSITVADMRSGNYESAITRLEARIGSAMVSDVCRGLISLMRGDDTEAYWAALSIKLNDMLRQQLRLEAQKVPAKVHRLSLVLFICFLLIYFVVIAVSVISAFGVLFA